VEQIIAIVYKVHSQPIGWETKYQYD